MRYFYYTMFDTLVFCYYQVGKIKCIIIIFFIYRKNHYAPVSQANWCNLTFTAGNFFPSHSCIGVIWIKLPIRTWVLSMRGGLLTNWAIPPPFDLLWLNVFNDFYLDDRLITVIEKIMWRNMICDGKTWPNYVFVWVHNPQLTSL